MRRSLVLALVLGCTDNLTPPGAPDAAAPVACVPDLDGVIAAHEFPRLAALRGRFRVSPPGTDPTIDLAGTVDELGRRVWDFTSAALGADLAEVAAVPVASRWYADRFPGAELALIGDGHDQVVSQTADAVWLHGFASSEPAPQAGQTLVVYAEPVAVYRFPFARGDRWTVTADVPAGTFDGVAFSGRDSYAIAVDASGRLALPELELAQAHRVRLAITSQPTVGPPITRRQVAFVFECLGEVVRATSRVDEPAEDFTRATAVRRWTPASGR